MGNPTRIYVCLYQHCRCAGIDLKCAELISGESIWNLVAYAAIFVWQLGPCCLQPCGQDDRVEYRDAMVCGFHYVVVKPVVDRFEMMGSTTFIGSVVRHCTKDGVGWASGTILARNRQIVSSSPKSFCSLTYCCSYSRLRGSSCGHLSIHICPDQCHMAKL